MSRLITVKGMGNVRVKPDVVVLSMELVSHRFEYEDTMELATATVSQLTTAIVGAGFKQEDVKTTNFNVRTSYESYRDADGNYKSKFDGYVCEQGLKLEFSFDMALLAAVLNAVAESGMEPRLEIEFSVKDQNAVSEELLMSATQNARAKAEILAKASAVSLGDLLSIDYNWGEIHLYSPTRYNMHERQLLSEASYAPDIIPEDIEVSDTVTFVWEIQ